MMLFLFLVSDVFEWSNGVTVSTLDFESSDGGSNPPWTFSLIAHALCSRIRLRKKQHLGRLSFF